MKNCLISNRSYNSILLECSPGQENGLQQTFYLQVYEKARDVYEDDHDEVIPGQEENEEERLSKERLVGIQVSKVFHLTSLLLDIQQ